MTDDAFNPPIGVAEPLGPQIRRILAPNPSPMTYRGTNTYLLGERDIAVIDPGPDDPAHLHAILDALTQDQRITHILVTHSHVDHSPLAAPLAAQTGAPVMAFGNSASGRSTAMRRAIENGLTSGGEGVDPDFAPTQLLQDGARVSAGDQTIEALHTPGHMGNHMCFDWDGTVFCGDLVMGWASSLVSPPDGDLTEFMASCHRLAARAPRILHSGHGAPIEDPAARLRWLIAHRTARETQILVALGAGPQTAYQLATHIYTETPATLLPAATRNVFAHLIDLYWRNKAACDGPLREDSKFQVA